MHGPHEIHCVHTSQRASSETLKQRMVQTVLRYRRSTVSDPLLRPFESSTHVTRALLNLIFDKVRIKPAQTCH